MHFTPVSTENNFLEFGMKMDFKINILTLNCWGIVNISRHRKERMAAIAAHIASSKYDFVFLQEVWCKDDAQAICKKTSAALPYSHYFYSGVIGSGLCVLSRSPIIDSAQYVYSLNGYAHKILHGDWYGGKLVGLCKVLHHGIKINLYTTHLHAEYGDVNDPYLSHRIVQAFEISQFVKMTSESADLSIIAGDFNTESHDLAYRLVVYNVGCTDAFLVSQSLKDCSSSTCGHPDNLYTTRKELRDFPNGKRIDYIMYKCGNGTSVKCLACETPLKKIPNSYLPYSDHEAVISQLHVFKSVVATADNMQELNPALRLEALNGCRETLMKHIQDLSIHRRFYIAMSCIAFILIVTCLFIQLPYAYDVLLKILLTLSTVIFVFWFLMATVVNRIEYNALISCTNSMDLLINSIVNEYGFELPVKPLQGDPLLDITNKTLM